MTIFAHDVQRRPKDFEVKLQENLMDLSIAMLRSTHTREFHWRSQMFGTTTEFIMNIMRSDL